MNSKIRQRSSLLALVIALISVNAKGQIHDLVQTDGIVHPLHKANIGRIIFMNGNIPLDQLKETDFLTSFALKPAAQQLPTGFRLPAPRVKTGGPFTYGTGLCRMAEKRN